MSGSSPAELGSDVHDNHGEAAVLVLAAGAGTRMRSDTPKVLHTLAGRSMLSHALHSVAKVAPQHLSWSCSAMTATRVAPAVAELADELGRPIDRSRSRSSSSAPATPSAAACRRCPRTSPASSW